MQSFACGTPYAPDGLFTLRGQYTYLYLLTCAGGRLRASAPLRLKLPGIWDARKRMRWVSAGCLVVPLLLAGAHAFVSPARRPLARPLTARTIQKVPDSCSPPCAARRRWAPAQLRARIVVSALAEDGATPKTPEPPLEVETLLFLIGSAALWGTYPTCVKLLYLAGPTLDPSVVVLLRFLIMAAVSVSALLGTTPKFTLLRRYKAAQAASMPWEEQLKRRVPSSVYLAAFELGVLSG